LELLFYQREAANKEAMKKRAVWLEKTVIPALGGTALLAGCPHELLEEVAAPLSELTYDKGELIAMAGEPADSMLVLLEGMAEVEAKVGAKIGRLTEGATFGEVAALGLFSTRTVTVRALKPCRVVPVPGKVLQRALSESEMEEVRAAFEHLVASRREQVTKGLPISALPIGVRADDVCARAVALQAERVDLDPDEIWSPIHDYDPCGPHFGVLVRGRAVMETASEGRMVQALVPGALFPEGPAAEYGVHVRALTACEGYRVRQVDFLVAVYSVPSSQEWFYRFKLLERETRSHLCARLSAVRGVSTGVQEHPSDADIHDWKNRRLKAIERARKMKVEKAHLAGKLPTMSNVPRALVDMQLRKQAKEEMKHRRPPSQASTAASRPPSQAASMMSLRPISQASSMSRTSSAPHLQQPRQRVGTAPADLSAQRTGLESRGSAMGGLGAYPAVRLPRLHTSGSGTAQGL